MLKLKFFLFFKPKVVYLRPLLSSLPFPKFWKQNVMNFGHKHVETFTEKTVLLDQQKFCFRHKIMLLLFVQQNCFVEPEKFFCWVSLLV